MLFLLLRKDSDWSDTVADAVACPDQTSGDGFLGVACCVGCHEGEGHDIGCGEYGHHVETPQWDAAVGFFGCPAFGLPDHGTTSYDWQAAEHSDKGTGVSDVAGDESSDEEEDKSPDSGTTEEKDCSEG